MKYSNAKFFFRLKYTKLFCLKSIFIFLMASCANGTPQEEIMVETKNEDVKEIVVGAERIGQYKNMLLGKHVGIVGNQSSMLGKTHLVDTLLSLNVDVVKVFSPEHGFRGKADAGEHVKSKVDELTDLPLISLYGSNKKPSNEQLEGVEVMVFDIQDVGVRFYTYISTLHYVMEACAENNIPLIVLDRPNPNGHYVDGPVLELEFTSFVGMHPVPIVHGMTIGEYAMMTNGEAWLKTKKTCNLTVVRCKNYTHQTPYSLPVPPSPNLRSDVSIQLYPSLCLLEATDVTVGRGTDGPFERYGHPNFPKTTFEFIPKPGFGSKNPKHNGIICNGYDLNTDKYARMLKLDLSFLINANKLFKEKLFVKQAKFFNLLAGNDVLKQQIINGISEDDIRETWQGKLNNYKLMRVQYLLYSE